MTQILICDVNCLGTIEEGQETKPSKPSTKVFKHKAKQSRKRNPIYKDRSRKDALFSSSKWN